MIVFHKLKFKNFQSYGNTWTEVDLDSHKLTAIIGKNGAGKTTMLNALVFALYGKSFTGAQKGKLVNSINCKGMEAIVEFSTNGSTYVVHRGVKPNIFTVTRDGVELSAVAAVKDFQTQFENSVLKIGFKNFTQTVVLGTASFTPFMELTAADRRSVVENLLGLDVLSIMTSLLKERVSSNTQTLQNVNYEISSVKERVHAEKTIIDTLREASQKSRESIEEKISTAEHELVEIDANIETLNADIAKSDPAVEKLEKVRDASKKIESKRAGMIRDIERFAQDANSILQLDVCPTCRQRVSEEYRKTIANELQEKKDSVSDDLNYAIANLEKLEAAKEKLLDILSVRDKKNRELSAQMATRKSLKRSIAEYQKELQGCQDSTDTTEHEKEIVRLASVLQGLFNKKRDGMKEREILSLAALMLKDSGVKSLVVEKYLPLINQMVNQLLAEMDFFLSFEFDSNFNELMRARQRDEFTYQNLSQGERRRLDIALLLTWRHIASVRNSCSTNILFVDEILDSSLDADGAECVLRMFKTLANSNVFIISHRDEVKDGSFDKILSVEKRGQFSVMS